MQWIPVGACAFCAKRLGYTLVLASRVVRFCHNFTNSGVIQYTTLFRFAAEQNDSELLPPSAPSGKLQSSFSPMLISRVIMLRCEFKLAANMCWNRPKLRNDPTVLLKFWGRLYLFTCVVNAFLDSIANGNVLQLVRSITFEYMWVRMSANSCTHY